MNDAIRDVLIRVRTEYLNSGAAPDMQPLVEAQKQVKDGVAETDLALKMEGETLRELNEEFVRTARLKEDVAAKSEEERRRTQESSHAHGEHGRSLSSLARPLTMLIHSTMHLAHATALLTAANEEDAEVMARKLLKYEGWIMGATGILHMIHAMHVAYHVLEEQAWLTAAAEAAALAPLALVALAVGAVIAVGAGIWKLGDAFDLWGSKARKAAEETRQLFERTQAATMAAKEFHLAADRSNFKVGEEKHEIRKKTDDRFDARAQLEELDKKRKELEDRAKFVEGWNQREKDKHARRLAEKERDFEKEDEVEGAPLQKNRVTPEVEEERKLKLQKLEMEQLEQQKQSAERLKQIEEQQLAVAQRKVDILAQQRDHLRDNLKIQQDIVHSLEQQKAAAEHAIRDRDANFGGLDDAKRAELERINEKLGKGETLNKSERGHIRQYGGLGGRELAEDLDREEGARLGADKKVSNIHGRGKQTPENELKSVNSQLDESRRQLGNMQKELNSQEARLRAAGVSAMKAAEKIGDTMVNILARFDAKLKELKFTLEQQRNNR